MAGAAPTAGTCPVTDGAEAVTSYGRGPFRCGAALALFLRCPPLCRLVCRPVWQSGTPTRPIRASPCGGFVAELCQTPLPQPLSVAGGSKKVQDKSRWSLSRPPAAHPAPQRGSGTGTRWSVWPPVGCDRWSKGRITEEKPPGFSLFQGGCTGWFSQKMEVICL